MQKLLVLTSTFPRWQNDTEPSFVYELCKQLSAYFDIYVLAPHAPAALDYELMHTLKVFRFRYFLEREESLCYQGGMLSRLRERKLRYFLIPFFMAAQFMAAYRLIKAEKISLIHAHWIIPQGMIAYGLSMRLPQPLKILCTVHGGDLFSLKGTIATFIKKRVLRNIQAISVVNPMMATVAEALCYPFKPAVSVIPMGVDFQNVFKLSANPARPLSLIFVGRLVEKKGVNHLLTAMPLILEKFPTAHVSIVGTGPLLADLQGLVNQLQVQDNVEFLGAIANTDLPGLYQQHQLAVFPFVVADNGDREGLPVVVSEAVGCGCCVVSSDLPGIEELIRHEKTGLLVKQNSSDAIAEAVIGLFAQPDKIRQYAAAAYREISVKQDSQSIARSYARLINSLAAG